MANDVLLQMSAACEAFITLRTSVGFLARVQSHVEPQTLLHRKHFRALLASELPLIRVGAVDVIPEVNRLPVAVATLLALIRALVRMDEHVATQIVIATKLLRTNVANVHLTHEHFARALIGGRC